MCDIDHLHGEMAVHMAATNDVLVVTTFVLSFLTSCFWSDLGLNCDSS